MNKNDTVSLKKELLNEYVKNIKWVYMPLVKLGAFNRFNIKNGQIVNLSKLSVAYSIVIILLVITFAYIVLLETAVYNNYLILPEFISVIEFTVLNSVMLININLANRHSGADLINNFIEIDAFLGVKETKFMRKMTNKDILMWSGFIGTFEVLLGITLGITFNLPIYVYVIGAILFFFELSLAYDNVFHVVSYKFLCLRVHYLNVALVKIANLNTEYLMDQLLSYPSRWTRNHDDSVDPARADEKHCTEAFEMIFEQMRRVSKCYRFEVLCCTTSLVIGTFAAVEAIIIFIKDPEVPIIRTFVLTAWFFVTWTIIIGITQQTDQFFVQIQRTKLICTYIQLTPNNSEELFRLSQSILDVLIVNDYQNSIYDLFYFDGKLLRSIATSVFIYITMQLQISFPKRNHQQKGN